MKFHTEMQTFICDRLLKTGSFLFYARVRTLMGLESFRPFCVVVLLLLFVLVNVALLYPSLVSVKVYVVGSVSFAHILQNSEMCAL